MAESRSRTCCCGFRHNATQLVTVGGVYLVGQVLVAGVMLYVGGDDLRSVASRRDSRAGAEHATRESTDRLSFALLVGAALFTPLAMAVWFAPPLVALDDVPAFAAMKAQHPRLPEQTCCHCWSTVPV